MWFKKKTLSSKEPAGVGVPGLLCFDFDGTMVDSQSEPRFHPGLTDRLLKLEAAGFMWAIVTGRALPQTLDALASYGVMRVPHFIVAQEYEVACRLPNGSWIDLHPWNKQCRMVQRRFIRQNKKIFRCWEKELPNYAQAEMFFRPDSVGLVATASDQMEAVCAWLEKRRQEEIPNLGFQRNDRFLRFTADGLGKGGAVVEIGRMLGLPLDRIFVAGDNHNDLSMLELPDVRLACPSNSVDEVFEVVRQRGGYVAGQRASAGMIEALDHWYEEELRQG